MKHKFISLKKDFEITSIYSGVFNRTLPKNYVFDGEKHNFWEILYVGSDQIELTEEENVYVMNSGDIIFHAPQEFHRLNSRENTTPHLINLSFTATGTLPNDLTNGFFSLNDSESEEFLNIVSSAHSFVKDTQNCEYSAQEISEMLSSFIIRLCKNSHAKSNVSNTSASLTYKTLVKLLGQNVLNNITMETLAEQSFISVSYIKMLFYRYAGISPKSYYNNLRSETAKKLLARGLASNEVAEKMNFSSPNYFSVFFKNQTGMTPLQYKKSLQKY